MDAKISSAGLVRRSCRDYTIDPAPDAAPQGLHMASSPRFHKLSRLRPPQRAALSGAECPPGETYETSSGSTLRRWNGRLCYEMTKKARFRRSITRGCFLSYGPDKSSGERTTICTTATPRSSPPSTSPPAVSSNSVSRVTTAGSY